MPDPQVPEQAVGGGVHLTAEQLERLRATFNANIDPQPGRPIPAPNLEPERAARWNWEFELGQNGQRAAQAAPPPPPPMPDVPWNPPPAPAPPINTRAEIRTGRRTRRDPGTYGQINPLIPPAPQQPQQRTPIQVGAFTGAEFRDNSLWITAEFVEGALRTPLDFGVYADTGRTLAPYAHEALKRIAEILRDINNLPEPRRREIPNATVGERMFNMIQLLMDKAEVSEQVQNEWQALATEYERHMGGGGLR